MAKAIDRDDAEERPLIPEQPQQPFQPVSPLAIPPVDLEGGEDISNEVLKTIFDPRRERSG